jgi:formate/nitrite transporter
MDQTAMTPDPAGYDAYKPAVIAALVEDAGVAKCRLPFLQLAALGGLAGAFIALGSMVFTLVMTGADPGFGPARLLGGVAFSLGLILVIVGGAELFTGNALVVMAWVDRRVTAGDLLRNWTVVWCANFAGALAMVVAAWLAGLLDGAMADTAARIATAKLALPPVEAFFRGALCNMLVCLAVWLTFGARTAAGKILAVLWPITAFVALGLEHSIANMYLIPAGFAAGAPVDLAGFAANIAIVTLGNVAGGAGGVALAYWTACGRYRTD